jgi:hypothetical protein
MPYKHYWAVRVLNNHTTRNASVAYANLVCKGLNNTYDLAYDVSSAALYVCEGAIVVSMVWNRCLLSSTYY